MTTRLPSIAAALLCATAAGSVVAAENAPAAAPAETAPRISQDELLARLDRKEDVVVLDVRTPAEFAAGHVPGALNVSHDLLAGRLGELDALRDKDVVLYCRSGRRVLLAEDVLRKAGFTKLLHLEGDWLSWESAHRPVELIEPVTPARQ